jgi:hypothetical protein
MESIRSRVRDLLTAIPAFSELSPEERPRLADNIVKVLSCIANPEGVVESPRQPSTSDTLTGAHEGDPVEASKRSLSISPSMVGEKSKAGAVRDGMVQFGALVEKLDFPTFAGGLSQGVFQAIIESSIQQMRVFGELIADVAETVDQFTVDSISAGAGRDWLAQRYPDALAVEAGSSASAFAEGGRTPPTPTRLVTRGEDPDQKLDQISRELGVDPPVTDASDPDAELRLVTAAQVQLAKSRQQLLISMMMLGMNRIVLTGGTINAKVVFDVGTEEKAKQ